MSSKAVSIVVASVAAIALSHSAVIAYQATTKSTWDGVYAAEQAKRAEPLYAEKCSNCHGSELTGNDAPALVGAEFSANWNDLTINDLFERIRLTMPADSPGSLSRAQVADIIALILQHAGTPAGAADLPSTADVLKTIKFVGSRPVGAAGASTTTAPAASTTAPPNF